MSIFLNEKIINNNETITLNEEELNKYQKWFIQQMKKKTGKTSINSMSEEEKKKFFNYIDDNWKSKEEKKDGE